MGWNLNDLASSAGAPSAASNLSGFVLPSRGTQHVYFRGTDDHIHELSWDRRGWRHRDLHAGVNAPLAKGDPAATVSLRAGGKHVVYVGVDGHVHELASAGGQTDWRHTDLNAVTRTTATVEGNPTVTSLEKKGTRHIFFRGEGGKVHEVSFEGGAWRHEELTSAVRGMALAAGDPSARAHEAAGLLYLVYRDKDGHVHQLCEDHGLWKATDLSASTKTAAPPAAGDPSLYVFDGQGSRHVTYRSADGHIHQLSSDDKGTQHEDLTARTSAPIATGEPTGYVFNLQGTQHVLYRAADEGLHELWWDVNGWHHDAPGAIGPSVAGRAAGYSFELQKTQHAVYRQPDGRVAELWWQPEGTGTGGAGKSPGAKSLSMKWDPIVFDGGIPVSGGAELSIQDDGRWDFHGHFHGSGFSAFDVNILFAVRSSKGALFTFGADGAVSGTLGAGSRDFTWKLSGTEAELGAAWADLQAGWSWQAQSGTGLEWGGLWGDVKGALSEASVVTAVVGPMFG
jgi:hypothetical protein